MVPSEEPMWASAPTKRRESFINHPGQRRTAERLRQRVRGNGWELRQRSSPKGLSTSDNPSVSLRLTAPFTQGSLRDGGCGLPRRPVGPPRNDNGFLSFRGAERRGNPYFYDGRGFGPPYLGHGLRRPNFVPKFGASVKSSAPTGPRDCRGSALSAERAAGQIRFLPDNIRVQHGVQRSEASAKPRPCSRRGCVN